MFSRLVFATSLLVCSAVAHPISAESAACTLKPIDSENELRNAINCFNTLGGGIFTFALKRNIKLSTALPDVVRADGFNENRPSVNLIIDGNGFEIDANGKGAALRITDVNTVTLKNVTIRNGSAGALYHSCNEEMSCLTDMDSVTLRDNKGTLGGAFNPYEALRIVNSTLFNNHAESGGAIGISGSWVDVTIENSTLYSNSAVYDGGAISFWPNNEVVMLRISNSTISGNRAGGNGGAIAMREGRSDDMFAIIVNTTIVDNDAANGSSLYLSDELQSWERDGPLVHISNSIIGGSDSMAQSCFFGLSPNYPTRYALVSGGGNLDINSDCLREGIKMPSDKTELPGNALGPLRDNGGSTLTHLPEPSSPARNGGNPALCAAAPVAGRDQRGQPRTPGACDIGAVEVQDTLVLGPTVLRVLLPVVGR
jgi:hypothetical protein